jgi:hypothetical protein
MPESHHVVVPDGRTTLVPWRTLPASFVHVRCREDLRRWWEKEGGVGRVVDGGDFYSPP